MAALLAYTAGLTTTGMDFLSQALSEVFGEVSITELTKDNLRYNVRMSMKSSAVVLVVLDSSSEAACKDIENGLYASDKYISYSNDKSLVASLNSKYGINMEVPVDVEDISIQQGASVGNENTDYIKEMYEARLSDKDGIIRNLYCTIRELEQVIEQGGYSVDNSAMDSVQEDNQSLRSQISDLKAELDSIKEKGIHTDEEFEDLSGKLERLQGSYDSLKSNYTRVSQECTEAQMDGSRKSGVIRDKSAEIERLSKQVEGLTTFVSQHQDCDKKMSEYQETISSLSASLETSKAEVDRLGKELALSGKTQATVAEYKKNLEGTQAEVLSLKKELATKSSTLGTTEKKLESVTGERDSLSEEVEELRAKVRKSDEYITAINTKNVELTGKVRVLEQSTSRDASLEDTLAELASARRKISEMESNVFHTLYAKAMPKGSVRAMLLNPLGLSFKNIRFVFAGSTESRKGTYKCILKEAQENPSTKYLVVDAVSETYVDYVFKIDRLVNGLKWFTEGGGVQSYITQTCVQNTRVLSPGLGYINDSFYLTVDWEKRLQELEDSGYSVILMCGDLSNVIGRVLFENFADLGNTCVYVHGNSVGSRTILGVSRGLSNIKNATIKYFDYDAQMSRFIEHMKQLCTCEFVTS